MQCPLRFLSLRGPLTSLRPEPTQFSRQASLTSAINRGIRGTQGGVDSLGSYNSARSSRGTGDDSVQLLKWRADTGDGPGYGRPERSFTQRSRNTERSGDNYGRDKESPRWQSSSETLRSDDRTRGRYSSQRQNERNDYTSRRAPRYPSFDRDKFSNKRETGSQFTSRDQASDGLNRKERRATIFGVKTRSDSGSRERNEQYIEHRDDRRWLVQSTAEEVEVNSREGSAGQTSPFSVRSDRFTKEPRPKPIRRARDGHGTWQEKKQDPESRILRARRRDSENKDSHDTLDKTKQPSRSAQPHVKVPLSIPYTTAGSEFLYGTHVVKAALLSGRRKLHKLYIYQSEDSHGAEVEQDNSIYKMALAAGVKVSKVRGDWIRLLNKMSDQRPHNGYVLEASPVPKLPVTALEIVEDPSKTFDVQLGHQSAEELAINSTFEIHGSTATLPSVGGIQRYPFVLMLDRIKDPGNLGSIIRSSYFLGAEAIVMIEHGTAPIGPVTLKSSASAAEYIPLLMVKNEHAFMRQSQENGWKFFAATSPDSASALSAGSNPLARSDMTTALHEGPCVLLLGSEEGGIRPQLQRLVNGTVGVESGRDSPQGLDSLNVGVAAALLMQDFLHGSKRAASESKGPSEKDIFPPDSEKVFEF